MTSTPTAQRLIDERNLTACECCGGALIDCQGHHYLYKKDNKNKVAKKLLNMDYNLGAVCYQCHHVTGLADSHESRVAFWKVQCDRYGHDVMVVWHNSIPYKIKEKEYI